MSNSDDGFIGNERNSKRPVILRGEDRPKGLLIAGNPGFAKSTLGQHLELQVIKNGRGVISIDPTGDQHRPILRHIPGHRVRDVIWFDTDNPVPIDFFSYANPAERQVLLDLLVELFELDNAPISKPRLQRIIGTLFDANENPEMTEYERCTLLDILFFCIDEKRREQIYRYAPHRRDLWEPFPKLAELAPIIDRMSRFFENPTLRTIFGAKRPKLNIAEVIRDNKILLVDLKDTPSDRDVGALICAKIQQATFARRYIEESQRTPFYFFIDEAHTILKTASVTFEAFLTRARKYGLCLTLINQLPSDYPLEIQRKLRMIASTILFNLAPEDAAIFKSSFPEPHEPTDRSGERDRLTLKHAHTKERLQEQRGSDEARLTDRYSREKQRIEERYASERQRISAKYYEERLPLLEEFREQGISPIPRDCNVPFSAGMALEDFFPYEYFRNIYIKSGNRPFWRSLSDPATVQRRLLDDACSNFPGMMEPRIAIDELDRQHQMRIQHIDQQAASALDRVNQERRSAFSLLEEESEGATRRLDEEASFILRRFDHEEREDNEKATPDHLDDLIDLKVGEACYIGPYAQPLLVDTLPPLPQFGTADYSESIRRRTLEKYGCKDPEKPHTEVKPPSDDDFEPQKPSSVPPKPKTRKDS